MKQMWGSIKDGSFFNKEHSRKPAFWYKKNTTHLNPCSLVLLGFELYMKESHGVYCFVAFFFYMMVFVGSVRFIVWTCYSTTEKRLVCLQTKHVLVQVSQCRHAHRIRIWRKTASPCISSISLGESIPLPKTVEGIPISTSRVWKFLLITICFQLPCSRVLLWFSLHPPEYQEAGYCFICLLTT